MADYSEPERYYDWMLWKMRQEESIANKYPDGYSTDWRQYEMKFEEQVVKLVRLSKDLFGFFNLPVLLFI